MFKLNWSLKLCDNNEKNNNLTPLSHEVAFKTLKSNSEVSKSNSWKITSFSKTILLQRRVTLSQLLQREPFLTIFL